MMIKKIIFLLCCATGLRAPQEGIPLSEQEQKIIIEIKDLLKNGTAPTHSFYPWVADKKHVLKQSDKKPVVVLADLLESLHQKDYSNIPPTKALSIFTDAVKAHHPDFSLGWLEIGKALCVGTNWWLSSTKLEIKSESE